jgi:hypothetical protein
MNGIIQFNKLPWIFRFIIPTKIDVDGIEYPLKYTIDLMGVPKSYGQYRLIFFFGFLNQEQLLLKQIRSLNC